MEVIAAAAQIIEAFKPNDPLDPLESSIKALSNLIVDAAEPPLSDTLLKLAVTALLNVPSRAQAFWELAVEPAVRGAMLRPGLAWVHRAFVAKKLPTLLRGQNSWAGLDVVKHRIRFVISSLVQEAILADATPQETKLALDALHALLTQSTEGTAVVQAEFVRAVTSDLTVVQNVLTPLLATRKLQPAVYCAIEDALCSVATDATVRTAGLAALPAQFEGKGGSALKAAANEIATQLNAWKTRQSSTPRIDEGEGAVELTAIHHSLEKFLKDGEQNAAAFQFAVSNREFLEALLSVVIIANSNTHCSSSRSSSVSFIRTAATFVIFSALSGDDARGILGASKPLWLSLCTYPSTTAAATASAAVADQNEITPAVAVALDEARPTSTTTDTTNTVPLTADSVLDLDMTVVECQLIVAKKLLTQCSSSSSASADDAAVSDLRAGLKASCPLIATAAAQALHKVSFAEKILKQQQMQKQQKGGRPNKRQRDDDGQQNDIDATAAATGEVAAPDGATSPVPQTIETVVADVDKNDKKKEEACLSLGDLKSAHDVLSSVNHLSHYFAGKGDTKVIPSWLR